MIRERDRPAETQNRGAYIVPGPDTLCIWRGEAHIRWVDGSDQTIMLEAIAPRYPVAGLVLPTITGLLRPGCVKP